MKATLEDDNTKLEVLRYNQEGLSQKQISELTGVPKSTVGDFLNRRSYSVWWENFGEKPIASGSVNDHHEDIETLGEGTYIAISAQNNTYVHTNFMDSLEVCAAENNARVLCGTFTYNKSGFQNLTKPAKPRATEDDLWFDPRIKDYIVDKPIMLCEGLIWCGELNILPTAVNPLSGLHSYTRSASGIVPHAKLQLESIPTHKNSDAKMMYTTGAVTKRNYIQKKAGQKAEFHHVYGALLIEVDSDGDWFVRQLIAEKDNGCFYDLNKYYTPNGSYPVEHIEGINWGDLHSEKKDDVVYDVSFRKSDSILDTLKPKHQFVHDVLDFTSRNHHNINDPYFRFTKYIEDRDSVRDNILDVIDTLSSMQRDFCQTVVVESNHDLALERWLKTADYKADPANAIFFLECQLEKYKSLERSEYNFSIFEWAVKHHCKELQGVRFLKTDESFRICDEDEKGIECGQHGHNGANGSRGGIAVFQRMGSRYNVGHTHCLTENHLVNVRGKGWVDIKEVVEGEMVSSYENGKVIYTEVLEKIEGSYTGSLFSVGKQRFKQEVTDNHNMYLADGTYISLKDAIFTRSCSDVPITANSIDETDPYPIEDVDIKKIVAFCADGHLGRLSEDRYSMRFHFKKQRKIDRCKELFGDDITDFKKQTSGSYKCSIKTGSPSYLMLMNALVEQKEGKKYLPEFLIDLNNKQSEILLEELIYWDGTFEPEKQSKQFSTVKQWEANLVSTLTHRLGYRTTCKLKSPNDPSKRVWHVSWCSGDHYSENKADKTYTKARIESWKPVVNQVKNLSVYCLRTEKNNFWVRHRTSGQVSLTGNSAAIKDGVYYAGVSGSLDMGYNVGGSSWSNSHIVTYPNGKRAIITIKNGKWRK